MLLADIGDTPYNIMLLLHILAMFVAFAPAFVHPFVDRDTKGDSTIREKIFAGISMRSMRVYGVALIVGGFLGFGVAGMSDDGTGELVYRVADGWVLTAVIVWVAMNGVLHALIIPGERAIAAGDESKAGRVDVGGPVITVLFLVTMYLMVFKPGA